MEGLPQLKSLVEYRSTVTKLTINSKELASLLDISLTKARALMNMENAPVIRIGKEKRLISSQLDKFLVENIGAVM